MALALDGNGHASGSAASVSASLTTANTNCVAIAICYMNFSHTPTISGGGLTWSARASAQGGGGDGIFSFYAIAASTLSAASITATADSGTPFTTFDVFGVSGADTVSPFDGSAVTDTTAPADPASITTTAADTFIFGGFAISTASPTEGAGYTKISGADFMLSEYKIVSSPQSGLSVTVGTGVGNSVVSIVDAIVQAAAAGGDHPAARRWGGVPGMSNFGSPSSGRSWFKGLSLPSRRPLLVPRRAILLPSRTLKRAA